MKRRSQSRRASLSRSHQRKKTFQSNSRAPCRGPVGGRSPAEPPVMVPPEEEVSQAPPVTVPLKEDVPLEEEEVPVLQDPPIRVSPEQRGWLVAIDDNGPDDDGPIPPLVSSPPIFFSQNHRRFFSPYFSHKHDRFVG
jgi:hypothetical protein